MDDTYWRLLILSSRGNRITFVAYRRTPSMHAHVCDLNSYWVDIRLDYDFFYRVQV